MVLATSIGYKGTSTRSISGQRALLDEHISPASLQCYQMVGYKPNSCIVLGFGNNVCLSSFSRVAVLDRVAGMSL